MNSLNRKQSEPYLAAYLHSRGAKLGLPIGGTFELTARCNFRCPMCYVHLNQAEIQEGERRELTAQEWIHLAQEARDRGMVFALLTGGEPFLRQDFFEIYNAMKAMGLMISINTNGSLLDGEIRRQLLENPPFRVNVSLYGGSEATYRSMCGQAAFHRVVENIGALEAAGVDVRVNLSITPYNRQDLGKICEICRRLGVHVKGTSYMYPSIRVNGGEYGKGNRMKPEEAAASGVEWDLLRFTPEEFSERAAQMEALTGAAHEECAVEMDSGVSCRAGSSSFWLTWDGRMLPCGMMPRPEAYPLLTGYDEAWQTIREQTRQIRMPEACAQCEKKQVCGVCAAMCVTETGFFDQAPAYMCRMTEETIRLTMEAIRKQQDKNCSKTGEEG